MSNGLGSDHGASTRPIVYDRGQSLHLTDLVRKYSRQHYCGAAWSEWDDNSDRCGWMRCRALGAPKPSTQHSYKEFKKTIRRALDESKAYQQAIEASLKSKGRRLI